MNADEFVAIVKAGSDKLRVDRIILSTGNEEVRGKGMMHVTTDQIVLHVTVEDPSRLPTLSTGYFSAKDFWRVKGVIEDHLEFTCSVAPAGNEKTVNGVTTIIRNLNPVMLVASEWDTMTYEEVDTFLEKNTLSPGNKVESGTEPAPIAGRAAVQFEAKLAGYPLVLCDSGTSQVNTNPFLGERSRSSLDTFSGELDNFAYALIKEDDDVTVHFLSNSDNYISQSEAEDERIFRAFLGAIAFTHGVHAWPYRIEHWRHGAKVSDRVTARRTLKATSHTPFSEQLAFNAQIRSVEWDFRDAVRKAFEFFATGSTLSKEVAQILFLVREAAAKGVHSEITTLALCTLFENVIRLLFRHHDLEDPSSATFREAKQRVCELIKREGGDDTHYARLFAMVNSAASLNIEGMFRALVSHYGLTWQGDMDELFGRWKKARNPLVHEAQRANRSADEFQRAVTDESRIAGGINILLLKEMGYCGYMRSSAFEDKHRRI